MTLRHLRLPALLLALATAGCAATSSAAPAGAGDTARPAAAPAAMDAAGTYTFTAQMGAESLDGVIRIARGGDGAYTGTVSTASTGDMAVRSVDVQGPRVRVTAQGRAGEAVLTFTMNGRDFTGGWTLGPSGGTLRGRMQPAS